MGEGESAMKSSKPEAKAPKRILKLMKSEGLNIFHIKNHLQIDEDILQEVIKMGFDKNQLRESLRNKLQNEKSFVKKFSMESVAISGAYISTSKEEGHPYDLRKGPRVSQIFHTGGINLDLLEDMDTSESEESNIEYEDHDDDWVESEKRLARKRGFKPRSDSVSTRPPGELIENLNSDNQKIAEMYKKLKSISDDQKIEENPT